MLRSIVPTRLRPLLIAFVMDLGALVKSPMASFRLNQATSRQPKCLMCIIEAESQ